MRPPGDFDPDETATRDGVPRAARADEDRARDVKDVLNRATGMDRPLLHPMLDDSGCQITDAPGVGVVGLALAPPLPPSTPEALTARDKLALEVADRARTAVLLLLDSGAPGLSTTMESRVEEAPLLYVVVAREPTMIGALKAILGDVPEPIAPEVGSRVREASAADLARLEAAERRRHRHKP